MPNGQQDTGTAWSDCAGARTRYIFNGETPGYNSHMGYDPNSRVTFVTWTNLPISVEGKWTSLALVLKSGIRSTWYHH